MIQLSRNQRRQLAREKTTRVADKTRTLVDPAQLHHSPRVIRIRGARQHNLKNLALEIPTGQFVVVTGPSGSGKSSLAFHTLFAEGQRRFIESLSAYARQFLDQLEKPEVDGIDGLSPAIAIEQRSGSLNPRSTVATVTEIYEHLRVIWAAAGVPHDPKTGERLTRMSSADMVESLGSEPEGTKLILLAPIPPEESGDASRCVGLLRRQGFVRVRVNGELLDLEEAEAQWPEQTPQVEIVVDRLVVRDGVASRLADSIETALRICGSEARVLVQKPGAEDWEERSFQTSYRNPKTGFIIGELSPRHFSFNSHLGACLACEGLGIERYCDPDLLIGDPELPLLDGAITGWWKKGARRGKVLRLELEAILGMFGLPEDTRVADLPDDARQLLFFGGRIETGWKVGVEKKPQTKAYLGLCVEAERKWHSASSEAVKRRISRVMAERPCGACKGHRLKPEILAVKLGGESEWLGIQDFCQLPVEEALNWLNGVKLPEDRKAVCGRLIDELAERLSFLTNVGLGYIGLDRASGTLSGGEAQRIRLATQLGSGLTGVLYVLDEPSIGLHPADTDRLIDALINLRDRGNSVIVVEHDEAIIRSADWVIELGPGAGEEGGLLLGNAPLDKLPDDSPTRTWLSEVPKMLASHEGQLFEEQLTIHGATEHNLKDIDVSIPLGMITCLTGPSGSGKSTLGEDILMRALKRKFHNSTDRPGAHKNISGMENIGKAVVVDQAPIGRSPRSNPATFTGAFDLVRDIFSKLPISRQRGYGAGRFSFNTQGGRCERCQGAGRLKIEMHFLPDAWVECTACGGRRFNRETLEVTYKGLDISQVLQLSVSEANSVFGAIPKLANILGLMDELGLGYLKLGQPANTLSGGEAQRLKLAVELARPAAPHTFYYFDEPTTGLHFGDVDRLLNAFTKLRDAGHTVLVVEHHLAVMAAADHIIDLGPGGGRDGGQLVASGSPAGLMKSKKSLTAHALRTYFAR